MPQARDKLAGFAQHGVRLTRGSGDNARAETCPICGSSTRSPFTVNVDTLLWNCVSCGVGGEFADFLELMQQRYATQLDDGRALTLQTNRGVHATTLRLWGVGWQPESEEYVIPFRAGDKITNLCLWRPGEKGINTTGSTAGLLISPDVAPAQADVVWICEGAWDTMVVWTALRNQGIKDCVIGLPGALSFPSYLAAALGDKTVVLLYDHDKSGTQGEAKARKMLATQPRAIASVRWPEGSKKGYDARDLWKAQRMDPTKFLSELYGLLDKRLPGAPASAPQAEQPHVIVQTGVSLSQPAQEELSGACPKPIQPDGPGLSRDEVVERYREWMLLPNPEVLDVMFGMLLANRLDGSPIWLFLVGPPGCGKTELVMSTYGAPLIASASTMTIPSLISGSPSKGMGDPSLIPQWNGRTLAFKDFTVILTKLPKEREEIFGILRGAYDGQIEKGFGNVRGVVRYRSRFGILSGVTAIIEQFGPSHSVVGERFLKYYMRDSAVLRSGEATITVALDNCDEETQMRADLRETARAALDRKVTAADRPSISAGMKKMFVGLAMWVSNLRGAVSRDKYPPYRLHHSPQAEIGTRPVKQLYRLASGIAIFKRKAEIGMDEYRAASHVARFSVPDMVEKTVRAMYVRGRHDFVTSTDLSLWTHLPLDTIDSVLEDLRLLKVVVNETGARMLGRRWMLARGLVDIMEPLGLYTRERVMARR